LKISREDREMGEEYKQLRCFAFISFAISPSNVLHEDSRPLLPLFIPHFGGHDAIAFSRFACLAALIAATCAVWRDYQ